MAATARGTGDGSPMLRSRWNTRLVRIRTRRSHGSAASTRVEHRFDLGLVTGVGAGRDSRRRMALGDTLFRTWTVGTDGRGVHERRNAMGDDRIDHASRTDDVGATHLRLVVGRLDLPRQVHDDIGTGDEIQRVALDVGDTPIDGRRAVDHLGPRHSPSHTDHRINCWIVDQRTNHGAADVPGRAEDHYTHEPPRTRSRTAPHVRAVQLTPSGRELSNKTRRIVLRSERDRRTIRDVSYRLASSSIAAPSSRRVRLGGDLHRLPCATGPSADGSGSATRRTRFQR